MEKLQISNCGGDVRRFLFSSFEINFKQNKHFPPLHESNIKSRQEEEEEAGWGSGYNTEHYQRVGDELWYQCVIRPFMLDCNKAYDFPITAALADKGQSELRGLIKANQRGKE